MEFMFPYLLVHQPVSEHRLFKSMCPSLLPYARLSIQSFTLSPPSSKSTFSQPFKEKFMGEVVRIGSRIIFHLSKL